MFFSGREEGQIVDTDGKFVKSVLAESVHYHPEM